MASLVEVLDAAIRSALAHVHTGIPAEVTAYDPVTNTVVAKPVVKRPFFLDGGEREYDELPEVPFVPVVWPRGGGYVARLPLEPGDYVWLMFSEASLAEWRTSGQTSAPIDARRHSIGWPYAVPGAFPDTSPMSPLDAAEVALGGMVVGEDGGSAQMLIGGLLPGIRFGKLAVMPVALAPPLVVAATASAAAATADAATSAPSAAALTAIGAALSAITAIPANAAAAASAAAAVAAIGTANTAQAASAAAATAAAAASTLAAAGVPSTLVKSV